MSLVSDIGEVLNSDQPLTSIEVLPGDADIWLSQDPTGQRGFLLQEGNLGIPQKVVYKAYIQAISVFQSCPSSRRLLDGQTQRTKGDSSRGGIDASTITRLIHSSSVMLLANPAHQTALNARKRLVLAGLVDPLVELRLMAALLTLRECSKESIIWHHRRWLLRFIGNRVSQNGFGGSSSSEGSTGDLIADEDTLDGVHLSLALLGEELKVASKAVETYRRNYFAWSHRTRVVDALLASVHMLRSIDSKGKGPSSSESDDELLPVLMEEHKWATKWVDLHVSDYTAMQYLRRIDTLMRRSSILSPQSSGISDIDPGISQHSLSLLQGYPEYESVWMYARFAGAKEDVGPFAVEKIHGRLGAENRKAEYRQGVQLNARRFLAWTAFCQKTAHLTPRDALLGSEDTIDILLRTAPRDPRSIPSS
ncbi:hypothetical protein BXZ70DRAFT_537788 [Cristinia sonorae]|uniref:Uncharacterized protein n=1 Tax=Cristinia sonorae TaxID=1940300 RepID=A0A8K0UIG5_9AGAR|nr:hypothetical protein BXZ70DRAFT_537788 [Cristinia sonorae]